MTELPEAAATRLSRRERLAALPRAVCHSLLRLLKFEHRYYLTIDGKVAARFTSAADYHDFVSWLTGMHGTVFNLGESFGRERCATTHDADTGTAGPS